MAAGKRSEIVTIEAKAVPVADGGGGFSPAVWSPLGKLWADVKPQRATEAERAGAERTLSVYLFTVLSIDARAIGLDPAHRLTWLDPIAGRVRVFNIREVRASKLSAHDLDIVGETE